MPNNGPNDALVLQFENDYDHLFQQMTNRLRGTVRVKEGNTGTMTAFALLGEVAVEDITGNRHGTTTWVDSPSYRRWAVKADKRVAQMLDQEDRLEVLVDLEMGYAQNSVFAMNREIDKCIIDAVTATAVTGATGTGTSAFDTTEAAVDGTGGYQIAAASSGLSIDKMRKAAAVFNAREVGVDEMNVGTLSRTWVTDASGMSHLMQQTEATSTDYIGVQIVSGVEQTSRMPLVAGRIPFYMGFRIMMVNQLNLSGSDHINVAFHNKAMGLAFWGGRMIRVDDLPEHEYARGVYVKEHFGAVRIHDRGVLSIVCTTTL